MQDNAPALTRRAILVASVGALSACATTGSPTEASSIKVVSWHTDPNVPLRKGSTVSATVEYAIASFHPGAFSIFNQFDTGPRHSRSVGQADFVPRTPTGQATINVLIGDELDGGRFVKPLRMRIVIARRIVPWFSVVVAETPVAVFQTAEHALQAS